MFLKKKGIIRDLLITDSGDIVACGKIRNDLGPYFDKDDFAIVRFDQNGNIVSDFGNDGLLVISGFDNEEALSIKSFGNSYFVTGHKYNPDTAINSVLIIKINSTGVLDLSFGNNGKIVFWGPQYGFYYGGFSSIIQDNNKLIIGGDIAFDPIGTMYKRINSDATLDEDFGSGGSILFSFRSPEAAHRALSKQFHNKFLSLGLDFNYHLFMTRHNIDQSLSIKEEEISSQEYSVYPNPASQELFIKKPTSQPTNGILYDITGKVISNFLLNEIENKIDVSNIASGIYFLEISNNVNSVVKKIVIE